MDSTENELGVSELGVSELARRVGVAKTTAHRLLTPLCARGLAERDEQTGRYRLGMRLCELGQLALDRNEMRTRALPVLRELQHVSGFTPLTTRSIHSDRQYALALAQVRKRGFAVNADEALDGLAAVAAPVLGRDGSAKAAISIVGPSDRLLNGIGRPARLVQVAARRLSKELCL